MGESTTYYSVIVIVAVISFVTAGLLALATYFIDRNANQHDVENDGKSR